MQLICATLKRNKTHVVLRHVNTVQGANTKYFRRSRAIKGFLF